MSNKSLTKAYEEYEEYEHERMIEERNVILNRKGIIYEFACKIK